MGQRHLSAGVIAWAIVCVLIVASALASGVAGTAYRVTNVSQVLTASVTNYVALTDLNVSALNRNDTCSIMWKVTGSGTVNIDWWAEVSLDVAGESALTTFGYGKPIDTPVNHWAVLSTVGASALYIPLPGAIRIAVRENAANSGLTFKAKVACQ